MSIRNGSRCAAAVAIGSVLSIVVSTLPALERPAAADELATAGTLAWLGCWRLDEVVQENEEPEPAGVSQLLCLEPSEGPSSLSMRAIVAGEVVAQELLIA